VLNYTKKQWLLKNPRFPGQKKKKKKKKNPHQQQHITRQPLVNTQRCFLLPLHIKPRQVKIFKAMDQNGTGCLYIISLRISQAKIKRMIIVGAHIKLGSITNFGRAMKWNVCGFLCIKFLSIRKARVKKRILVSISIIKIMNQCFWWDSLEII
jgi:hypothetical protein